MSSNYHEKLTKCILEGNTECFLEIAINNTYLDIDYLAEFCCKNDKIDFLFTIINCTNDPIQDRTQRIILSYLSRKNKLDNITKFVSHEKFTILKKFDHEFVKAAQYGRIRVLRYLIKAAEIPFSHESLYKSLIFASQNGHLSIIKVILKHFNIEPSINNNQIIISAYLSNKMKIVDFLLHKITIKKEDELYRDKFVSLMNYITKMKLQKSINDF